MLKKPTSESEPTFVDRFFMLNLNLLYLLQILEFLRNIFVRSQFTVLLAY